MKKLITIVMFGLFASIGSLLYAQSINVGPGGIIPPGPYVYGTSGPGALPSCTANAAPGIDGALAIISNQTSPIPSPTLGGKGYVTPVATASTGQQVAWVKCHAVTGEWSIVP